MQTIARIVILLSFGVLAGCTMAEFVPTPVLSKSTISGWAVYSSLVSRDPFVTQIFLKNLDIGETTQLTNSGNNGWPRWSPDGSKIMFLTWSRENSDDIYLMDKDGSHQKPIVASVANETMANWSPDGNKIVFVSNESGNNEIYVLDLNTRATTRLTIDPASDTLPNWSSDGKQIAFISTRQFGRSQIFVMNADGTDIKQLTEYNLDNFDESPIWCPDDSCIIFTRFIGGVPKIMLLELKSNEVSLLLQGIFDPGLIESGLARSPVRGYITFFVGKMFYAMNMKNGEIYPLGIDALDLSLYP